MFPLLITIVVILHSVWVVYTTIVVFGTKQYVGIFLIICAAIISFINKKAAVYFMGVIFLLGTFNFIAFTSSIVSYSFGFGINDIAKMNFKIQPFSFFVLIFYILINGKYLRNQLLNKKDQAPQ